jgi:hypothetical protein
MYVIIKEFVRSSNDEAPVVFSHELTTENNKAERKSIQITLYR